MRYITTVMKAMPRGLATCIEVEMDKVASVSAITKAQIHTDDFMKFVQFVVKSLKLLP